jgi:hypothetical protein
MVAVFGVMSEPGCFLLRFFSPCEIFRLSRKRGQKHVTIDVSKVIETGSIPRSFLY